ncbi:MAG TPA: ABC transporter permease [Aggregatilineales bacterium]|nr:ABC transporter permease [Aggregatilineales bacterium]
MVEGIVSQTPESEKHAGERLIASTRSAATFVLVMVIFIVLWQAIKAVFRLDVRILPNVSDILGALIAPVQEGKATLGAILFNSALFTLREAVIGFFFGAGIGFILAVIFAHSLPLERGLMPLVVASQTVPILAIAPMVVVWLKAGWLSVAVISAYLTFFPVTINTLRGLTAIPTTALELMQSYAATRWQVLVDLRIPNALPYILTALKISATTSIVGAIIGELPSGIQDGLGGAILNFNQYYASAPARLWATNLVAALTGIVAFGVVVLAERVLLRWMPSNRHIG